MKVQKLSPKAAVEQLIELHTAACQSLKSGLERYLADRTAPTPEERATWHYPELRVTYEAHGLQPNISRAYAKFQGPGVYTSTVTHPDYFKRYLTEQLTHLVRDYDATIAVRMSNQEIPYPYVLDKGDDLGAGGVSAAELALHFPVPKLSLVGDEIADGTWVSADGEPLPLALFDAVRVDYSLKRLQHYTGAHWSHTQPWILLTNYHRYVDQFIGWARKKLLDSPEYEALHLPGGGTITKAMSAAEADAVVDASPWHRFQMPAYHLTRNDGKGGVTLGKYWCWPLKCQNHYRPFGCFAPQLLADGGPLWRSSPIATHW